jgi:hypothetical protein
MADAKSQAIWPLQESTYEGYGTHGGGAVCDQWRRSPRGGWPSKFREEIDKLDAEIMRLVQYRTKFFS